MRPEEATAYTARCFRGEPASCTCACPFRMDVRSLLDKVGRGRWMAAYKMLRAATVFPVIVSVLCDEPCGERCQRALLGDETIAVRDIEAAVIRNTRDRSPETYVIPPKEQRVAVVGAGLSGLACALSLAQKRYQVTVFEKQEGWGGSLRPHERFADFDADIALQFSGVETDFRYGTEIGALEKLTAGPETFDAVYVATGAGGADFGLLEDWDPRLFTTSQPKVFLGGAVGGAAPMQALAEGVEAAKVIEAFLMTGKATRAQTDFDKEGCGRYLKHEGAAPAPRIAAAGADGYTADEARAEAARCLQCDCDDCLRACELLRRYRKDPRRMAVEVHADMTVSPFSSRTMTREAYSCNMCGYCGSICPEGIDMGALLHLSRAARMAAGIAPAALHDFWLREMDFNTSEAAFASPPKGRQTCEYAFYPGCQLGASNPEHVLRSYESLAAHHDMGIFLSCCGAPAYWAGDDERLRAGVAETRRIWEELGKPTLVFACATCMKLFAALLPDIPRVSLYEMLARSGQDLPAGPFPEAAIFDPCAARGADEMEASVRDLAAKTGVAFEELPERNRCCGYGGHIRMANPSLYDEITRNRAEASDKPYIVYCANCREVFASRGKDCAHILDVVYGLDKDHPVPTIQQKRDNSLRVKGESMKQTRETDFEPERHEWDGLTLIISDELQKQMESKLISAGDIKETIWHAETTGDRFCSDEDDVRVASLARTVITHWVEYRETAPETYEVLSAYYHRMRILQGEQSS